MLAGFDGYGADDPRSKEMQHLFRTYRNNPLALQVEAITATRYNLKSRSVYAL